jgi:hypothetical protein
MSKARFDTDLGAPGNGRRAIERLNEAQTIIDTLDRPDIGARLQEVIDALDEHIQQRG